MNFEFSKTFFLTKENFSEVLSTALETKTVVGNPL